MAKAKKKAGESDKCQKLAEFFPVFEEKINLIDQKLSLGTWEVKQCDDELDILEKELEDLEIVLLGVSSKEIQKINKKLKLDYQNCLDTLKFFGVVNADGKAYRSNYEKLPENLRGFTLPAVEEIIKSIDISQYREIKRMEESGWQPTLQITPIAHSFKHLADALADRVAEFNIKNEDKQLTNVYYSPVIFEERLSYDQEEAGAQQNVFSDPKKKSWVANRDIKDKYGWVKANQGCLVDIVPMKTEPVIERPYNLELLAKDFQELIEKGQRMMTFESYLVAQMVAIKSGKYLDGDAHSILQGSFIHDINFAYFGDQVSYAVLDRERIHLDAIGAAFQGQPGEFVLRPTIRINWLKSKLK